MSKKSAQDTAIVQEHEALTYLKEVLADLTRENVYVADSLFTQEDANNAKTPVIWLHTLDETRFNANIPKEIIEDFKKIRIECLEAICYFERTTNKDYSSFNGHMPYPRTRRRQVYGQYFVIDLIQAPPKKADQDEITTAFHYRQELAANPYVLKINAYLKQFGIIYMAEFDPNEVIKKFKKLLEDEI